MKALVIAALSLILAFPAWGAEGFLQLEESDNLSQFIRSNARHYWNFMRSEADLSVLKSYLSYSGVVAGDPHLGNFAPLPLLGKSGRRNMEFVNVDFDDAGRAPFVLDFVRYVIAVEATFPETKKRSLEAAYIQGLTGKTLSPPSSLAEIMSVSVAEYDQMVADHLRKNTDRDGFVFEAGKIEPYRGPITREEIMKVFVNKKVIDLARRPKDRGGSAEGLRIWVLVEESSGFRQIIELKEYAAPGVSLYQKQPAMNVWLREVREVFWPGLDGSSYDLIEVGGTVFWIRPKGAGIVDIPYSSEKRKKMIFASALADFDAHILGLAHGRQFAAEKYRDTILENREAFHEAVEQVVKDYLVIAKKAYKP
jgi:hypothetical protein